MAAETATNMLMKQKSNKMKSGTIIMREKEPLAEMYGEEIGQIVRGRMEEVGVKIICEAGSLQSDANFIRGENGAKISHEGAIVVNAVGTFLEAIGHRGPHKGFKGHPGSHSF